MGIRVLGFGVGACGAEVLCSVWGLWPFLVFGRKAQFSSPEATRCVRASGAGPCSLVESVGPLGFRV